MPNKEKTEESKDSEYNDSVEVDMFVVGLQEMVDLSVLGSISGKNDKLRTQNWQNVFKQALETRMKGKKFVCSVRKIMYGCAILLFVREDLAD